MGKHPSNRTRFKAGPDPSFPLELHRELDLLPSSRSRGSGTTAPPPPACSEPLLSPSPYLVSKGYRAAHSSSSQQLVTQLHLLGPFAPFGNNPTPPSAPIVPSTARRQHCSPPTSVGPIIFRGCPKFGSWRSPLLQSSYGSLPAPTAILGSSPCLSPGISLPDGVHIAANPHPGLV